MWGGGHYVLCLRRLCGAKLPLRMDRMHVTEITLAYNHVCLGTIGRCNLQ